jgi:hypothetical protein
MNETLRVIVEMNACVFQRFRSDLEDLTPEEAQWRPLPEANSIALILRHLCIDARWHADRVDPSTAARPNDSAPSPSNGAMDLDLVGCLQQLERSYVRFIAGLRATTLSALQERTASAYEGVAQGPPSDHFLGYHLALHVAAHGGQIRSIRNLYCRMRGAPARFFPDNPSFPP